MVADARTESLSARAWRPSAPMILGSILVALVLVWLIVNFVKTPGDFVSNLIIGITNGAVYGLIAIGYSLVYGILELINFAHGDVFMLGGMMTSTMVATLVLSSGDSWYVLWPGVLLCLLVAMVFCGGINAGIERVAYRRLRTAPRLAPLITAIGFSFILQNVGLVWRPTPDAAPDLIGSQSDYFTIFGVPIEHSDVFAVVVTVPLLVALVWFVG